MRWASIIASKLDLVAWHRYNDASVVECRTTGNVKGKVSYCKVCSACGIWSYQTGNRQLSLPFLECDSSEYPTMDLDSTSCTTSVVGANCQKQSNSSVTSWTWHIWQHIHIGLLSVAWHYFIHKLRSLQLRQHASPHPPSHKLSLSFLLVEKVQAVILTTKL